MKHKIKELDQNAKIIFIDSKDYSCTKNKQLLGETITAVWRNIVGIMNK